VRSHISVFVPCTHFNDKKTKKTKKIRKAKMETDPWAFPSDWSSISGTPLLSDWTYSGMAGLPVTHEENSEGRRTLRNSASRTHRILSRDELENGKQARWLELEVHGKIRNLNGLSEMRHLTALFASHNAIQKIPPKISQLSSLTLLDLSHNQISVLPPEIGDMGTLTHLNIAHNLLKSLPAEMGKLFRLKSLNISNNPLPSDLLVKAHGASGTMSVLQYLLDKLAINTPPPPQRKWFKVKNNVPENKSLAQFTVFGYNVLSGPYATTALYSYCPTWALNWEYRKNTIIKEITFYDSDIIGLQEVESVQFKIFFEPELMKHGYEGIFAPKSRAKTMVGEDKKHVDGCALFWKASKFKFHKQHLVEFAQVAIHKAYHHDSMINRVMPKDNIALMAVLEVLPGIYKGKSEAPSFTIIDKSSADSSPINVPLDESVVGTKIVVCAAHACWDPEFCDVKLIQTMMLVHECARQIEAVAEESGVEFQEVPLIICGDFNSFPDSGVIEYLQQGLISKEHPDLKTFRSDMILNGMNTNEYDDQHYSHALKLESSFESNALDYTNFTHDFKGLIDYIFASPQSLQRTGYLGGIDPKWIADNKIIGFPHVHVPSDHIPIMAQYALRPIVNRPPAKSCSRFRRRSNSFSRTMDRIRNSSALK